MALDQKIYPDDMAERMKAQAGEPYRPSNGSEGNAFEGVFCEFCAHDKDWREWLEGEQEGEAPEPCPIWSNCVALSIGDEEYPKELVIGEDGQPTCTNFKKFDLRTKKRKKADE